MIDVYAIGHVPIPALVIVIPVWRRRVDHAFEKVEVQLLRDRLDAISISDLSSVFAPNEVLVLSRKMLLLRHFEVELRLDDGD